MTRTPMRPAGAVMAQVESHLERHGPSTAAKVLAANPSLGRTVYKSLSLLHAARRVHISLWLDEAPPGHRKYPRPVFKLGRGEDVIKPRPKTDSEKHRAYRQRLKERDPNVPTRKTAPAFSPEEDELILKHYHGGRAVMEPLLPNRTWRQINNRAGVLNVHVAPENRERSSRADTYTFEEDAIILRLWSKGGAQRVARALPGRTLRSIEKRAVRLGLGKRKAAPGNPLKVGGTPPPRIAHGTVASIFDLGHALMAA